MHTPCRRPRALARAILAAIPLLAAIPAAHADYIVRQPGFNGPTQTYTLTATNQDGAPLPEGYAFGAVPVNTSVTGAIVVTSNGNAPVRLISIAAAGAPEFALVDGASQCSSGMVLAPGDSCYSYPAFSPTLGQDYSGSFSISGNHNTTLNVPLTGSGATTVALNAYDAQGNQLTGAVDTGNVPFGQAAVGYGRILNTGTATATLAARSTDNAAFTVLNTGGTANCSLIATLAPGQYCNAYVSFSPATAGPASAVYTLTTSSGHSATLAFAGSGTAIAPTIGSFTVPNKTTADTQFTLTPPTSNSAGGWSYASSNSAVATVSGANVTIVGAGSTTITATQAASGGYTNGSATATLTVANAVATSCTSGGPVSCATWDPSAKSAGVALANNNLTQINSGGGWDIARTTAGVSSGRWYWEIHIDALGGDRRTIIGAALGNSSINGTYSPGYWNSYTSDPAISDPRYYQATPARAYGQTYVAGDTVSVLLDADNRTLRFYRNCVDMGATGQTLPAGTYYPFVTSPSGAASPTQTTANFGQQPFLCSVPAGFNAGVWQ